jgi:hypothetical protein
MAITRVGHTAASTNNVPGATVAVPSGTTTGDVMMLYLECDGSNGYQAPTGFTQVYPNQIVGTHTSSVHYRVVQAGDPSSYSVSTAGSNERGNIYFITYRDVDISNPVITSSRNTGSSSSTANFTSMTPAVGDCRVIAFVGTESGNNSNPFTSNWPTNFTEVSDNENGPPGTGTGSSGAAFADSQQTSATLCSGSVTISTGSTQYVTTFIALQPPSNLPGVTACPDVTTSSTNVVCSGLNFEAVQGTGKLELADSATYASATKVTQTIDSWSDTSIQFDVVQGSLANDSVVYVFVTNDSGDVSVGFAINLGLTVYLSLIDTLLPGHYWRLQNTYTDTGSSTSGLRNMTNTITGGGGAMTTTEICENTTHSWRLSSLTAAREIADVGDMNGGTVNERTFCGWIMLGGVQKSASVIYKEGGGVQNLCFLLALGNTLTAQMADSVAGNNVQAFGDFKLTPNRPYHICYRYSYTESPKEFRLFIDGDEQTSTDGNPITGTNFSSHSGDCGWGDPDGNLETGGTDIAYAGQADCYYAAWAHWAENDNGGNVPLNKTTEIRDKLFRRGALPNETITTGTQAAMQTQLDALADSEIPDWPLGLRIEDKTGGGDLELEADNITFSSRCTLELEWRATGVLTWVQRNGSSLDSSKIYTPLGGTVTIVNSVPVVVTVKDVATGAVIEGARVLLTSDTGGSLPYQASVTITRASTTATVTHTSHGFSTGQKVLISGASQYEYTGVKTITVTGTNTYTFSVSGSPATPATGTITSTTVLSEDLTDVAGQLTTELRYSSDQPVGGRVRRGTDTPFYRTQRISSTITEAGLNLTILMVKDE